MGKKENLELAQRIWRGISDQDVSALEEALADDCVQEWPQSAELVRGKANIMAVNENYPGLPNATLRGVVAGDDLMVTEVQLDERDAGGRDPHVLGRHCSLRLSVSACRNESSTRTDLESILCRCGHQSSRLSKSAWYLTRNGCDGWNG
jgi:hypothetical protein